MFLHENSLLAKVAWLHHLPPFGKIYIWIELTDLMFAQVDGILHHDHDHKNVSASVGEDPRSERTMPTPSEKSFAHLFDVVLI